MSLQVKAWVSGYRVNLACYTRIFSTAAVFTPSEQREVDAIRVFPPVRKYTADLVAAGFRDAGDLTANDPNSESVFRLFFAPDGLSYLVVVFNFSSDMSNADWVALWPAKVIFLASTYFSDEHCLTSTNQSGTAFLEEAMKPPGRSRTTFPGA